VDWTNARNRRWPGSTLIVCLDEPGELASQVDGHNVVCLHADRSRSPWDREAVSTLKKWIRDVMAEGGESRDGVTHCGVTLKPESERGAHGTSEQKDAKNAKGKDKSAFSINHQPLTINPEPLPPAPRPSPFPLPPPTLLHAHNLAAWQYAVLAAWGTGVRTVYTQHGANLHNQGMKDRLRGRLLALLTDELVTVSAATASAMGRSLWIPRSGIRVVVNGVEGGRSRVEDEQREDKDGELEQKDAKNAKVGTQPKAAALWSGSESKSAAPSPRCTSRPLRPSVQVRIEGDESGPRGEARRRVRATLGIPEAALVLGSVGRLAHVKGYDRLIRVVREMIRSQETEVRSQNATPNAQRPTSNAQQPTPRDAVGERGRSQESGRQNTEHRTLNTPFLLLVGDGPERGSLERLAAELGVADRVHFAGFQADPRPFLDAMDMFVVPSRSEGVSMGLLEAMAAGVPVAVTDVGASREVIDDGACGSLLPDDETLWPELLRKVVNDPGRLTALAEQARGRVETQYSMKATLDGYERLYCRLAGTRRRSGCGDDCACGKK
jgi:glycosyltransferase involved in cell wall biosynthesis